MNLTFILGVSALFQQGTFQGATSPASGDTTGYWQQRVQYSIVATLNEEQDKLQATARLVYKNNSPDTLHEMFFHQYLNAFRPGSKWSAVDARENRVRFQKLGPNDIGYERLTQSPTYDGTAVTVDYPGAPDSTVMHFRLPKALAPGDSAVINFAWDARPSTVPRRQGRRGRTYDFAQWFPKVAVYDGRGWEPNPLVPAGELYGEFGDYDVTMVVKDDQVLASTGVPVNGDPGWARVSRNGEPYVASGAYGEIAPNSVTSPAGYRAVRFLAKNVHHFAWSASPDYRYEGGVYVRHVPGQRFQTWDTVGVNVLFKPGDDTTWGGGRAVERTITAAKWLESLWGPYAYPQITNVHRIDPGGTEFPMMIMDGSADQGLILHEFGHVFTYGILANNEWRSGWLDEGLTTFQTDWAQRASPQDRDRITSPPRLAEGYRVNATSIAGRDSAYVDEWRLDLMDRAQPIGTPAYDFSEFGIYNEMIYSRAALMYGQLRELMGDSVFHGFAHDYYTRWALRHVDERAMRTAAERAYGKPLGWFFDQWVHRVGLMDYALSSYRINRAPDGYETVANIERRGELRHPMPVGVLTQSGWTIARASATADDQQQVRIVTRDAPKEITLDPYHATFDWDRRNDSPPGELLMVIPEPRFVFNWPYLDQNDRSHTIVALSPTAWYSNPQRVTAGVRAKTNYLSAVDQYDMGVAYSVKSPTDAFGDQPSWLTRVNAWVRFDNLYLPGMSRPAMGVGGDVNYVDGLLKADLYKNWDLSPFIATPGPKIGIKAYANVSMPSDTLLMPEQWARIATGEIGAVASYRTPILSADSNYVALRGSLAAGGGMAGTASEPSRGYARGEGSVTGVVSIPETASQVRVRAYGALAPNAPLQREIFASSVDPLESFNNDLFRPRGAVFKQKNVNYLPIGGAGLRGFALTLPLDAVVAMNGEVLQRLTTVGGSWGKATISLSGFGDVARAGTDERYLTLTNSFLSDAGAGIVARGRIYDRNFNVRFDVPFFVNQAGLAGWPAFGANRNGGSVSSRWVLTIGDVFF